MKENGYVTGGFGTWHLTPGHEIGAAGSFDHWPTGWGFDHWYGFLTGAAGQYDPIITQDNSTLGVPEGKDGELYYFSDDITDKAVKWLHAVRAQDANKPWFLYYSTGCSHAPHHVAKQWADKYKRKFDGGWDKYREETLERQKKLGIAPEDTQLSERPELSAAWDSLSDAQKKLYARQMEVFAGYSENAGWNVGRLLDSVDGMGDLENTLIICIWGDNGASMEGTLTGSFNETTFFNGVVLEAGGDVRSQFAHCIDVAPTILEAIGIPAPKVVDGIEQEPMDGTSFAYTFDAAERHTVQYFENYGSRAISKDGWWAGAKLDKVPWDFSPETLQRFDPGTYDPDQDEWQLYYLPDDFSQAHDLAAEKPEKLAELKELLWQEAELNHVVPLLAGFAAFFGLVPPMPTVTRFPFAGDVQNIQTTMIPRIIGRSYSIEAELQVPDGGAEGVLIAFADFIGGFALWIDDKGLLNHTYQFLGMETYKQASTKPVPTGDVTVKMLFEADEPKPGAGGRVTLWANDEQIGEGRLDKTISLIFTTYAGMDIGRDNGGVVDLAYEDKAPYAFTGTVRQVVFNLHPASHEDLKSLHEHDSIQSVGQGVAG